MIYAEASERECGEFPGGLVVKDLVLSLLWLRFDPWSGNLCMPWVWLERKKKDRDLNWVLFLFFFFFGGATPAAHGGFQAKGQIGATAANLCQSHNNARSEPHLRLTPQLMTTPDS